MRKPPRNANADTREDNRDLPQREVSLLGASCVVEERTTIPR